MKIIQNNSRFSVLGLVKFLAAIAIVLYHITPYDAHWRQGHLLVEFFFFITGYFTYKHFQKDPASIENDSFETKSRKALQYTIKKFLVFLPFIIVSALMHHAVPIYEAVQTGSLANILTAILYIPMDIFLVNSLIPTYWALWFLSAMVIIFPIFCLICQTKHKQTLFLILLPILTIYYIAYFATYTTGIESIIRALMGLCAGIAISNFSDNLRALKLRKIHSVLLQIAEIVLIICAVVSFYPHSIYTPTNIYTIYTLIFFFAYLVIFLSRQTFSSKISSPTFDFLEQISMVIFLVHMPIISLFNLLPFQLGAIKYRLAIIICSFLTSVALFCFWEYVKAQHFKQKKSKLLVKNTTTKSDQR